jgi:hypothetical protein
MRVVATLILLLFAKVVAGSLIFGGWVYFVITGVNTISIWALTAVWVVIVISFVGAVYNKALWIIWFRKPTTTQSQGLEQNKTGSS